MVNNTIDEIFNYIYLNTKFKPEVEKGNIEYKLRLDTKDNTGLSRTSSQLLWRLNEGKQIYNLYEAFYILGVKDNGEFSNLSKKTLIKTINIFKTIIKKNNCKIKNQKYYNINNNNIYILQICKLDNDKDINETCIGLVGPSGSGKTTLLSILLYDEVDNGNGFARNIILTHEHEKSSGKTSSLKRDSIGFKNNKIINYNYGLGITIEDKYLQSDNYVTIVDNPGDKKFIKTLLYSISSSHNDIYLYCIEIDKLNIYIKNNKSFFINFIKTCESFNIKLVILLTKSENKNIKNLENLQDLFNKLNLKIIEINSENNKNLKNDNLFYYLEISCISKLGIEILIDWINYITKNKKKIINNNNKILFNTNEIYNIPNIGNIFYGKMIYGNIKKNDKLYLYYNNNLLERKINNIHKKLIESSTLKENETGCLQLHDLNFNIDKTCILINNNMKKFLVNKFIFKPFYKEPKNKDYLLFCESQIYQVKVYKEKDNIIVESNINKMLVLNTSLIILKDINNCFFGKGLLLK